MVRYTQYRLYNVSVIITKAGRHSHVSYCLISSVLYLACVLFYVYRFYNHHHPPFFPVSFQYVTINT